jgi:cyclophilin family peptidyl-prolyl cis-trans isomerase
VSRSSRFPFRSCAIGAVVSAALLLAACSSSKPAVEVITETTVVTSGAESVVSEPPAPASAVAGSFGTGACVAADGSAKQQRAFDAAPVKCIDLAKTYTATMETSEGKMTFTLLDDIAPITVNSFVNLARAHYFDGIYFHRVVPNFVLQAGDPGAISEEGIVNAGSGGPGYNIVDEFPTAGQYKIGSLAMAKTPAPDSGGSQFFVISGPNGEQLPPQYSLFGSVADDAVTLQTIAAIGALGVADGPPSKPVMIKTLVVTEN